MLLAVVYTRYPLVTLAIGAALGMQHFEQGFVAGIGLLLAIALSKNLGDDLGFSIRFCLDLLVGTIIGKLALIGIFYCSGAEVNSGRIYVTESNLTAYITNYFFRWHFIIWSALGLGWLIALKYTDHGIKSAPLLITLIGLTLTLSSSVDDQTRVLAIVTFLPIATYWLLNNVFLSTITNKETSALFLMWALTPWSWAWKGQPKWSKHSHTISPIFYISHFCGSTCQVTQHCGHFCHCTIRNALICSRTDGLE